MRLRLNTPRQAPANKKKVLFVCLGNSCRSQMAEGFARCYGSDVMEPSSAGLTPALVVAPLTKKVMLDRNIDLSLYSPKSIHEAPGAPWDLVVNMSGLPIPREVRAGGVREWEVRDPISGREPLYVEVANEIENLVMQLVLELRRAGVSKGGR